MNDSDESEKMARPQVGIDRLPVRRQSCETKEVMNCKSCRKRKIKCSRLKPSCEACQIFNSECVYDSVPKKRGPKTDVLDALVKRVNGLEERLQDERRSESRSGGEDASNAQSRHDQSKDSHGQQSFQQPKVHTRPSQAQNEQAPRLSAVAQFREPIAFTDALLDTFFSQIHEKPYYILDEMATRQRLQDGHLPQFLINAIHAVSIKYVPHLCGGPSGATRTSQQYALHSRNEIDCDEPTIDHLQALLLLSMANMQCGKGKKSYMLLSHAITMALALSLNRELPPQLRISPSEREGRRKLFWTCYIMDRFTVCGSQRPHLISDESICLRLPAWSSRTVHSTADGTYFSNGSSSFFGTHYSNAGQGGGAMLVESVRLLGLAHRYIAAGGVKGDSHFPWHSQSTLSKLRSDLDNWATDTQDAFVSLKLNLARPDNTMLVMSKLIYHLIHCLIYRPFLPVDLAQLSASNEHQSWQAEALRLCFMHANAIIELVEIGNEAGTLHWPSFVGYCIFTAGTIHIHGAHYMPFQDRDVFAQSAESLSRELALLSRLRSTWAAIHHQWESLQTIYASHARLVQSLANNPSQFSPTFQTEDFFDRWTDCYIDAAHVSFADVSLERLYGNVSDYPELQVPYHNPMDQAQRLVSGIHPSSLPSQATPVKESSSQSMAKRRRMTTGYSEEARPPLLQRSISEAFVFQSPPHGQPPGLHAGQTSPNNQDHPQSRTLAPVFTFNATSSSQTPHNAFDDPFCGAQSVNHQTPSGVAPDMDSGYANAENDPFLSFLEGLAGGSDQDLGFYLGEPGNEEISAPPT